MLQRFPMVFAALAIVCSIHAQDPPPVGDLFASDASVRGSILFASGGTRIMSGSTVTAGEQPATLRLARGGEVRVCPLTQVSVTSSTVGRDLMVGMNVGSVEAHYELGASADTVLTPDFRILLAGPGVFHFAISADSRGNACIRSLTANTASLIVSELNGSGTYQVKPDQEIFFKNGHVDEHDSLLPPGCGCPPVPVRTLQAVATPPEAQPPAEVPAAAPPPVQVASNEHVQVETPFVFKAGRVEDEVELGVARLRLTSGSALPSPLAAPPAPKTSAGQATSAQAGAGPRKSGFFGKIKSFFASVFR